MTLDSSEPTTDTPRTVAWCSWHKDYSDTCRLVGIIEQGSGGGGGIFACGTCREMHNLVPVADLP